MSKQSISIIVFSVVAIILIVVIASVRGPGGTVGGGGTEVESTGPATRESIPRNIVISVPNAGEETEEGIAAPDSVAPAPAHRGGAQTRSFSVKLKNNLMEPGDLVVCMKDTANISFEALDKDYFLTNSYWGVKLAINRGETNMMGLTLNSDGIFSLICESCPDSPAVGRIVVATKEISKDCVF